MAATPAPQDFHERKYFAALDGLRTLSIVPVVWHHSTPYTYEGVLGRGATGVDLFFAISGFLITTLLIRERGRDGAIDLGAFFLRRAFRIFPLYFLVLGLNWSYAVWVRPDLGPSQRFLERLPYYATYTANWLRPETLAAPSLFVFAWSLCTEEQFYLFWAPVLRWVRRLRWAGLAMLIIVLLDLAIERTPAALSRALPAQARIVVSSFATPIGLGALAAMVAHHPRFGRTLTTLAQHRWVAPCSLLVVVSLVVVPWAPLPLFHAALALLVFSYASRRADGAPSVFEHPAITYVGRISYGIYLWHVAVIGGLKWALPELQARPLLLFLFAFPLSVAVAAVSYRGFEARFLSYARRFRREGPASEGSRHGALDRVNGLSRTKYPAEVFRVNDDSFELGDFAVDDEEILRERQHGGVLAPADD
jgi:peptidoglycan/LPS O-acetylase OafA/YrhL